MTVVSDIHLIGLAAARPAASSANNGYYYTATDTSGGTTYRSNGTTWVQVAGPVTAASGGDSTHTAVYASRPAASNAGDLFFPSDGFVAERDTGAAWVPWGPLFPFTAPVDGDFSWVNQGGASVSTTNGGIYLSAPASASANGRLRVKTAPATPYVITAAFLPLPGPANTPFFGLVFRQSSDGKLQSWGVHWALTAGWAFGSAKWTSETAFSAYYTGSPSAVVSLAGPVIWARIADNGTNRIVSYSMDGQNWYAFHTVGRTDFLTADQVGFWIQGNSNNVVNGMTLLSWKQS